jgi:LmbE family N-acetylglucosaminyl deacetylase
MDHEMVSLLARAGTFAYGIPNVSDDVPRPAGAVVPHLYYCDPFEDTAVPYSTTPEPTTVVDVSAAYERKERMLACHASQREWLRAHHGMDEYMDAMRRHAEERGRRLLVRYAETFVQHKGHSYPEDDVLAELFPAPRRP